ncbi:hypothetical protein [Cognatiyoonia sp. IB215182]|uniref:hypothetical protein n=1 Tax=Cognatiyoonia sp. IB215182 TaxID=3097353 RepID=UPI002A0D4E37|nr:hypothetical protein [Cognatiyoonia sp. IB215182]MDX8355407.1 hypothetical protein [Cognatiyoonia sp. IB215182]
MGMRKSIGAAVLALAGCTQLTIDDLLAERAFYDHWDIQGQFKSGDFVLQNVTQPDLVELLTGHTFVAYEESGGRGKAYGAITVLYYGANGIEEGCMVDYITGRPLEGAYAPHEWASVMRESSKYLMHFPLLQVTVPNGNVGFGNLQYKAETGQLAEIAAYPGYWRDVRKGHLQAGIPAGVYTACPEFPSAESLGSFVNEAQTSWNYFELVEQDPGKRIHRPDLVTAFTAIPLDQVQGTAQ